MPDSYVSGMLTSTLEGLVQMKDVAKLRWDDVYTKEQEDLLVAAVQPVIEEILSSPQVRSLVRPVVVRDLSSDGDLSYYIDRLELHPEGFCKITNRFLRSNKKTRVEPTRDMLKHYKVSMGDVMQLAEKLGIQL